ncbi:hypothetical protein EDD68_103144 [Melghiribacillus thermohalophilus]|uniref:Uncharacterized protein n=1 Tax=Melghiribacillus thermohalophilus TaxID=1324956 RepID=A0A4R3NB58_9BACI|nr:hypothetical protein [Melghiribacillus thermohalophilus]TCT25589.1 hypothetical protein EDD68_103144 [Melghiribacillus thermohalophilus]
MGFQFLFYWVSWILWIICFFFQSDEKKRFYQSSSVLMLIILSNSWIYWNDIGMLVPLMYIFIISLFLLSYSKRKWKSVLGAIAVGFGYGAYQIFEYINPLWLIFPSTIVLVLVGYLMINYLTDHIYVQIGIWLSGITYGETLHSLVHYSYGIDRMFGDDQYLFHAVLFIVWTITIRFFKRLSKKLRKYVQAYSFLL